MFLNTLMLASQSPRRKSLLDQLGYTFSVQASDIDEAMIVHELPADYVMRLALAKADKVFRTLSDKGQKTTVVLGSDTSVVLDNIILGKPNNLTQCINTLSLLSNRQHEVLTAVAVVSASKIETKLVRTKVLFKAVTLAEIKAYWKTGEPLDKAGSYAIQGIAGQFIKTINGSYSAVVGLPLYETAELLSCFGLPTILHNVDSSL